MNVSLMKSVNKHVALTIIFSELSRTKRQKNTSTVKKKNEHFSFINRWQGEVWTKKRFSDETGDNK